MPDDHYGYNYEAFTYDVDIKPTVCTTDVAGTVPKCVGQGVDYAYPNEGNLFYYIDEELEDFEYTYEDLSANCKAIMTQYYCQKYLPKCDANSFVIPRCPSECEPETVAKIAACEDEMNTIYSYTRSSNKRENSRGIRDVCATCHKYSLVEASDDGGGSSAAAIYVSAVLFVIALLF